MKIDRFSDRLSDNLPVIQSMISIHSSKYILGPPSEGCVVVVVCVSVCIYVPYLYCCDLNLYSTVVGTNTSTITY